jgi:hypothetical protein
LFLENCRVTLQLRKVSPKNDIGHYFIEVR